MKSKYLKKRFVFLASILIMLLLVPGSSLAGTEIQVTTDLAYQGTPDISGDNIVWQNYDNGIYDIYMYDILTGTVTQVTANTDYEGPPVISGDKIAWQGYVGGIFNIYMYDISSGIKTQVSATNTAYKAPPAISGDKIVWQDYRNGNADVYMYNISTGTEVQVTTNTSSQGPPDISGDKIVWSDYRNGFYDIYMYDILTGTEVQVTTNTSYKGTPVVSGDKIAWQDYRNGNADIYMYDILTGIETQVTTDTGYQGSPAIFGDKIVWQDNRNGNPDIYMYDISSGTELQITTDTSSQGYPSIFGNTIVWNDFRSGNSDIYMLAPDSNNTPPVADAGVDQMVVVVGTQVELDGTLSYDEDLDPLAFSWSLKSTPVGSTAVLSEPSAGYASFTADMPSDDANYVVELIVNDGTVNSAPINIEILAITADELASIKLKEFMEGIESLSYLNSESFRNSGSANLLSKKAEKILKEIGKGNHKIALDKIDKLLVLLDGCTLRGEPDTGRGPVKKDEVVDCAEQEALYDLLIQAKDVL